MTLRTIRINCSYRFICLWLFAVTATNIAAQDITVNNTSDEPAAAALPARNMQDELLDARELYTAAFEAEQYAPAADAANKIVMLTGEIYGSSSVDYALANSDLAAAQGELGDLTAAATNYKRAIYLIEEQEGIVSARLIQPLMGLANVQNAGGQWDQGLETYNRALRLNHVEYGLNNLGQMPIRDGITESYLGLGSIKDANFQQELQLRIVRDEFSSDETKLAQASNKLAGWYQRSNQQEKEVLQLEATVRTIRAKIGSNDPSQIPVLRDLAAAYQRLDISPEQQLSAYRAALNALEEARRINDASDNPDQIIGAEICIEIGDTHSVNGQTREARRSYTDAWQILTSARTEADVIGTYFGAPTHIGPRSLPDVYPDNRKTRELWNSDPDRFQPGSLQALVDVDDYGLASNVRVTEANPPDLLEDRALSLLKRYQFRPRFEGGQPVATSNLPINHVFNYLPDKQDTIAEGDTDAAPLVNPRASD